VGWKEKDLGDWRGRTVLITGANSGVGREATRALVAKGARVLMACRDRTKAEAARAAMPAGPGRAEIVDLDLADLEAVRSAAERIEGVIDVLIANGAVMGGRIAVSAQGYERQMATNHLGHAALIGRLLPQIRERVVIVSSLAARRGQLSAAMDAAFLTDPPAYNPDQIYGNTKQANLLFAQELARRLSAAGSPLKSIAVHPGVARTNLFTRQMRDSGWGWAVPLAIPVQYLVLQSPQAGAWPLLRGADDPGLASGAFVGPTNLGQIRGTPEVLDLYPQGRDVDAARRLWELTQDITGVALP
jgi:NAD(P)-dependent dehydrogenase (short-subunit alcohol dehydrogenase family)